MDETTISTSDIYNSLHPKHYDEYTIQNHKLIYYYYQTIPKYYLLSSDNNVLVCNMMTGAGKTLLAVFTFLNLFDSKLIRKFNKQYIERILKTNNKTLFDKIDTGNIFIIGPWITEQTIINTLMNPVFGYITPQLYKILRNIHSRIPEEVKEAQELRKKITNRIKKNINFYGYQTFFNELFGYKFDGNMIQHIDSLMTLYLQNKIEIEDDFKEKLKNSIIIIDEMQNLYSSNGLNTYGFALFILCKFSKELNCKILFMSGTVFNSSISEIIDVLNIINEDRTLLKYEDYMNSYNVIDGITSYKLKKDKVNELCEKFYSKYIYYNPVSNREIEPIEMDISKIEHFISHNEYNNRAIVFNKTKDICKVIYIGNIIIASVDDIQPFITYTCIAEGKQKEAIKNKKCIEDDLEIEDETNKTMKNKNKSGFISLHDAYIPSKDRLTHGIIESNGIFIGKFLQASNIKSYSTTGYNLIEIVIDNALHKEKTIVYHNKLRNFGLLQYAKILDNNGCFEWRSKPKDDSICKNCGKSYSEHSLSIDDKIKKRICNNFIGIKYAILTGDLDQKDREDIIINYNMATNLFGNNICVVFVSNVAYSGVSFLNTTNLIMISKISDMSKWKQIAARIIRTNGHVRLPKQMQVAKIYTFIVDINENKTNNDLSEENKYYMVNSVANKHIDDFIKQLSTKNIGHVLFNKPDELEQTTKEKQKLYKLFVDDVINNFEIVIKRIMIDNLSSTWLLDNFINRLMNNKYTSFFFDISLFSKEFVLNLLHSLKSIEICSYDNKSFVMLKQLIKNSNREIKVLPEFSFMQIEDAATDPNTLIKLIEQLQQNNYQEKIKTLHHIFKYINRRFHLLSDKSIFWDTIYEIHDEYYENDEQNFFENHYSKNRNKSNMIGFYYGDYIVFKDGTTKLLDYSYPEVSYFEQIPFKFKITSRTNMSDSKTPQFYIRLNIIEKQEIQHDDLRKVVKGIDCNNYKNIDKLIKCFPEINVNNKKEFCRKLLTVVIDKQYTSDIKAVYSPFEK